MFQLRNKIIRRVVLKVGSSLLVSGKKPNVKWIDSLVKQIAFLKENGMECVLVTSGAIGCGAGILNRSVTNLTLPQSQAYSSIGQLFLMNIYQKAFFRYHLLTAQLLLTAEDCHNRLRYLNVSNTLTTLLQDNILPIVNQNDAVAVDEICFGDNDQLGALITHLIRADLFIVLTETNGFYDYGHQKRFSSIEEITKKTYQFVRKEKSQLGRGGMKSKLHAAKMLASSGEPMVIVSGRMSNVLKKLFKGEDIGTYFFPKDQKMSGRSKWIAFAGRSCGKIEINEDAYESLLKKGEGLSIWEVKNCSGSFKKGDIVSLIYKNILVAKGLSNFSHEDLFRIKGLKREKILLLLPMNSYDQVIYYNNLVVLKTREKN